LFSDIDRYSGNIPCFAKVIGDNFIFIDKVGSQTTTKMDKILYRFALFFCKSMGGARFARFPQR